MKISRRSHDHLAQSSLTIILQLCMIVLGLACGGGGSSPSTTTSTSSPQSNVESTTPNASTPSNLSLQVRLNHSSTAFAQKGQVPTTPKRHLPALTAQTKQQKSDLNKSTINTQVTLYTAKGNYPLTPTDDPNFFIGRVPLSKGEVYALESTREQDTMRAYLQAENDSRQVTLNRAQHYKALGLEAADSGNPTKVLATIQRLQKFQTQTGQNIETQGAAGLLMSVYTKGHGQFELLAKKGTDKILNHDNLPLSFSSSQNYWTEQQQLVTGNGTVDALFEDEGSNIESFFAKRNGAIISNGTYVENDKTMNTFFVFAEDKLWPYPPTYSLEASFPLSFETSNTTANNGNTTGGASGNSSTSGSNTILDQGLQHLNALRTQAGLQNLNPNAALARAAFHHAKYLVQHKPQNPLVEALHEELHTLVDYTGRWPSTRAAQYGYIGSVGEALGTGASVIDSINQIFSSVYHRLALLNFYSLDVGIARSNELPLHQGAYLESVDVIKVGTSGNNFTTPTNTPTVPFWPPQQSNLKTNPNAPMMVIWPADQSIDIPLSLASETPNISSQAAGYPITIELNPDQVVTAANLNLQLNNAAGNMVTGQIYSKQSDPRQLLQDLQFVFLPEQRLLWNENYSLSGNISLDGNVQNISTSFTTIKPLGRLIEIKNSGSSVSVTSDEQVTLDITPPQGFRDIQNLSFSTTGSASAQIDVYDPNSLSICVHGEDGDSVQLNLYEGFNIKINVSGNTSGNTLP